MKLLPEFQTRDLPQLLSILKQNHKPPKREKNISLATAREKKLGVSREKKNLNKCLPSFCCQAVEQ